MANPMPHCIAEDYSVFAPKLAQAMYLNRLLRRAKFYRNLTSTPLHIFYISKASSPNSEMDTFQTVLTVFSTDPTFEREDFPVDLETGGTSGGNQCIIS